MFQLAAPVSAEIEIRKSRFIAHLYPLATRAEAQVRLAALRVAHPAAVHFCSVLICDGDSGLDDDGEPGGTAARPMYNVLTHKNVFNLLAVVVRYWGGTKLGAGGLARAYGQAVSEAIKDAELVPIEPLREVTVVVSFADESALRRYCEQSDVTVINAHYGDTVRLVLSMKIRQSAAVLARANNLLRGALQVEQSDQT